MLSHNTKKHLKKLSQKKYRQEMGEFTIEGVKGVEEAFTTHAHIKTLVVEQKWFEPETKKLQSGQGKDLENILEQAKKNGIEVEFASSKDVQEIKSTETFPGVLAVIKMAAYTLQNFDLSAPIVCLDGIKDPGNLGTIIRTADWFGIKNILLSEDCVDVYNEKVVRSTMGSIFRLTIVESRNLLEDLEKIKKQAYGLYGFTMDGVDVRNMKQDNKAVYIFGSESHGVRAEVQQMVNENYTIPRLGGSESLNVGVAAGIILSKITL